MNTAMSREFPVVMTSRNGQIYRLTPGQPAHQCAGCAFDRDGICQIADQDSSCRTFLLLCADCEGIWKEE